MIGAKMSGNYSEDYLREILVESIALSIDNGRLDLNSISVDESKPIPAEDLQWAIQTLEANGMMTRIDDFSYELTPSGQDYINMLTPSQSAADISVVNSDITTASESSEETPEAVPIDAVSSFKIPSAAVATNSEERSLALTHLIYESFIYNKTLDLTEFGPLILRDHKPDVYGSFAFSDEEIAAALNDRVQRGILFLRNVAEDGLDGGQDSYQILSPQPGQSINQEDFIPADLKEKFLELRDDFLSSEQLEQRMHSTELRSQYKAERSELFLMTDLPLDVLRSKEIMAKYAVVVEFAESMPEDLQKEYYSRVVRVYREYHRPNYLTNAAEKIEIAQRRIAALDTLNQSFISRRDEALRDIEEKKRLEEARKSKFGYKIAHMADPGIGEIKNLLSKFTTQRFTTDSSGNLTEAAQPEKK
jgi:hypothetical protein